jgi:DNA-binding MarR family transcriptional regulator
MESRKLGFELQRSSRLVKRYMDSDTSKLYIEKITGTHGWALGFFFHNRDRDVFQKDFEQEFNIRRSTASNILALIEKNGLIQRESVPYDARLKKITLTQKALDIQQEIDISLEKLEDKMKRDITDEELKVFFRVIDKINFNLERKDTDNDKTIE